MMKKLTVLLIPLFGAACALTDYPVITDEDQTPKVIGTHIVNTAGEAYIKQKVQVALIKPGGTTVETVWYTDQDGSGNQTISNRMNVGNISDFSTVFQGTTYLNNNREGCWNARSSVPASHSFPSFSVTFQPSCQFTSSILVLLAKGVRSMEAGSDPGAGTSDGSHSTSVRAQSQFGVTLQQFINVASQLDGIAQYGDWTASYGLTGYKLTVSPSNMQLALANSAGVQTQLNVDGVVTVFDLRNGAAIIDTRTGNLSAVLNQIANWVDANGKTATLWATFAGTTGSVQIGLRDSQVYRDAANSLK